MCDLSCVTNHLFQENITKLEFTFLFPLLIIFIRWFLRNPYKFNLKINPCFLNSIPIRNYAFPHTFYILFIFGLNFSKRISRKYMKGGPPIQKMIHFWRFLTLSIVIIFYFYFGVSIYLLQPRFPLWSENRRQFFACFVAQIFAINLTEIGYFCSWDSIISEEQGCKFSGMAASGNLVASWNLIFIFCSW